MSCDETGKVKVTTYYESLCPDSKAFINDQFYPTYQQLHEIMITDLNAYGKASVSNIFNHLFIDIFIFVFLPIDSFSIRLFLSHWKCLAPPLLNVSIKKARNCHKQTLFILFVINSLNFKLLITNKIIENETHRWYLLSLYRNQTI